MLAFFQSHAQAKLAAFPEAGQHEADGTSFERDAEFCDAELLALALRFCLRSGIDPSKLDQFFADQFGIAEISQGELGPWLALMMLNNGLTSRNRSKPRQEGAINAGR
jgi:hypothetical protein